MKKLVSFVMAVVMILSLCACGASGNEETTGKEDAVLNVGFGKVCVTPSYTVTLRGHGDNETRVVEGVASDIYATCVAFTSGEDTILVYTIDALNVIAGYDMDAVRAGITSATGVPGEHIFFGATHCHNSPDPEITPQYATDMGNWLIEAGKLALADQAPATMQAGANPVKNMNYVRHYENADGTYFGSNFGTADRPVGHVGELDSQLTLVKFEREEPKQDILMVNWQAHVDSADEIGHNLISASWPGVLRDTVTEATGVLVAYFAGANGNINKDSRIPDEDPGYTWSEYGQKMGNIVVSLMDLLEPVEGTAIKTTRELYEATIDHSWDDRLDLAQEVYDIWKVEGNKSFAKQVGLTYGFSSPNHASAVLTRSKLPATGKLELNAFSIGGMAFTTGTYEMWAASGLHVKENSPFDITFVITGNKSYIPAEDAYDYRSYEADTSYYVKGTAEALAEKYVEMLKSLK